MMIRYQLIWKNDFKYVKDIFIKLFWLVYKQCAFQNRLTKFTCWTYLILSAFILMQICPAFLQPILGSFQAILNTAIFFNVKSKIGPVRKSTWGEKKKERWSLLCLIFIQKTDKQVRCGRMWVGNSLEGRESVILPRNEMH